MAARLLGAAGRGINLGISAPPAAGHLPALAVTTADLLAAVPSHGYDPAGLLILRAAVAARHTGAGLPTTPEEIHVTHGAQHAIARALDKLELTVIEDNTLADLAWSESDCDGPPPATAAATAWARDGARPGWRPPMVERGAGAGRPVSLAALCRRAVVISVET